MHFTLDFEHLTTLPVMCVTAIGLAILWGIVFEVSKKKIYDSLPNTSWWRHAAEPMKSMMANFGYPKHPTDKFPNAITDSMARDTYAFLLVLCAQHFVSALMMVPVLAQGWGESSNAAKSLFVLGTLSDLGFDVYDSVNSSIRTFTNHKNAIPLKYWVVIVALHHTTALFLVLPMNLNYVDRFEYHQTAVSLLMAASFSYTVGCYKFSLDIGKRKNFLMYKFIALLQLGIILYTRVYLWFPTAISFLAHLKEEDDTTFFYGASAMFCIFSLFNLILVVDGVKATVKCIPKKFSKTQSEKEKTDKALVLPSPENTAKTFHRYSSFDASAFASLTEIVSKGARHAAIATKRTAPSRGSNTSTHRRKRYTYGDKGTLINAR